MWTSDASMIVEGLTPMLSKRKMPQFYKDLTGQVFGRLTVLEYAGKNKQGHSMWKCRCIDDNILVVCGNSLLRGATQSCGCYEREARYIVDDHTDKRYGHLVGIRYTGKKNASGAIWLWRCDCGVEKEVAARNVVKGATKSCGCMTKELCANRNTAFNKSAHREDTLKRRYNMTLEQWHSMFEAQGKRCAICRTFATKQWATDHDHTTGKVRAILCYSCNKGLGCFKDTPAMLIEAAAYLQRHSNVIPFPVSHAGKASLQATQ